MKFVIMLENPHNSSEGIMYVGRIGIPIKNKKSAQRYDSKFLAEKQATQWEYKGYKAKVLEV